MLTTILTIISALIGIIGGVIEKHYEPEAIEKRDEDEKNKELANQDSFAISKRLSDLRKRLRLRNSKKKG